MPEYILITIRSLLSFIVLLLLTRFMGKKQLSQLTFFDYAVGITIGSIAAMLAVDQSMKMINGIIGLVIFAILPVIIGYIDLKSPFFRRLTDGHPTVLIEGGKINEKNLVRMKMPVDELILLLREKNVFKLADVEFAVLETNGQLSVMRKAEAQPITAKLLKMAMKNEHEPRIVIMDGNVLQDTLKSMGYTEEWLLKEIQKYGAQQFSQVFLAQLEANGNMYVDLKDQYSKSDKNDQ